MLAVLLAARPDDQPGDPPGNLTCSPFGVYSPGSLEEVPGTAQVMIESLGLNTLEQYEDYSMAVVDDLGATWVRADFIYEGSAFRDNSRLVEKYRQNGKDVVGCIRPADASGLTDFATFDAELRNMIHTYPWITVWQIGNEGNLSWKTPEDYARFFLAGQKVVREECPTCKVALAGDEVLRPTPAKSRDSYNRIIAYIMANPWLGARPFDIFDYHFYGFYGGETVMLNAVDDYKTALDNYGLSDVQIWMTESATSTGSIYLPVGLPTQTEDQQAAELVRRFVTALGAGVQRVSWSRPYENYRYAEILDGYFDNTGLIYNGLGEESLRGVKGGTPKKSYYAYQTMTRKLADCFSVDILAPRQYRFSFSDGRQPVYVIWGAPGTPLAEEIAGPVTITSMEGHVREADTSELVPGPMPVFVERHQAV